jgi:metacaspase-1
MAKGISLHIGLNALDPLHYGGFEGILSGCEADAKDMKALAKSKGFDSHMLLTRDATSTNVLSAINDALSMLDKGDIFFLSYSGHGGQVPDEQGDEEDDKLDETWALFDRQLIDDELYALWGKFKPGVRIFVLSDSCHSGTVIKVAEFDVLIGMASATTNYVDDVLKGSRLLPPAVQKETNVQNEALYKSIQKEHSKGDREAIGASILLISGCEDKQLSADGAKNGLFTGTLLKVWARGRFKGGYKRFYRQIAQQMPLYQHPNYFKVGAKNAQFERQSPFTI